MPLFTKCNISLVSPECVCEVSAQNIPQIIYYMILKMPIFFVQTDICFGSDYHVYRAEIMRFKPY